MSLSNQREVMFTSQNKGQIAMEFVILIAVGMVTLLIFFGLNVNSRAQLTEERELAALKDLALAVRTELYTATTVSDGYYRVFTLPETIDSREYNITIVGNAIDFSGEYSSYSIEVPSFNGTLIKGNNVLRRNNGVLTLN